jgi:membrane protease YdiL (CAAX protease family)
MINISMLDGLMSVLLIFGLPARAIFRKRKTGISKTQAYQRSLATAAAIFCAFILLWSSQKRSLELLGLWPLRPVDFALIATSIAALILLFIIGRMTMGRQPAGGDPKPSSFPNGPEETRWFLIMASGLGVIWEILYRGYLQWSLGAVMGLWPAVLISAAAYGLAHGIKSRTQIIGSLISALLFSAAYALSHSLWWLIVLHSGLPMVGILLNQRGSSTTST